MTSGATAAKREEARRPAIVGHIEGTSETPHLRRRGVASIAAGRGEPRVTSRGRAERRRLDRAVISLGPGAGRGVVDPVRSQLHGVAGFHPI
jgi:hypothetical protein